MASSSYIDPLSTLLSSHPLHVPLLTQLSPLLSDPSTPSPPTIFIHTTSTPSPPHSLFSTLLFAIPHAALLSPRIAHTPPLFYAHALRALVGHAPRWDDGLRDVDGAGEREGFLEGVRGLRGKGRGVIVVWDAERLRDLGGTGVGVREGGVLVVLLRLAELTGADISVVLISSQPYSFIRPPLGLAADPFFITLPPPSKEAALSHLTLTPPPSVPSHLTRAYASHAQYLHSAFYSLCSDPSELAYLAHRTWGDFIRPWEEGESAEAEPTPTQLQSLSTTFSRAHVPRLLALHTRSLPPSSSTTLPPASPSAMPLTQRILLIASYLASYNPARRDLALLSRASEQRAKRKGGGVRKGGTAASASKKTKRLLGPKLFALERLLAIYSAILSLADVRTARVHPNTGAEGTGADPLDVEMGRAGVLQSVTHLTHLRLLHRVSPAERLDGLQYRCAVSRDVAGALAKEVKFALHEVLWED